MGLGQTVRGRGGSREVGAATQVRARRERERETEREREREREGGREGTRSN